MLPTTSAYPRAPWMQPNGAGFLTYLTAARLWHVGADHPWPESATSWCWNQIETTEEFTCYDAVFALHFLDAVPQPARARQEVERFRTSLRPDGTLPVPGGVDREHVRASDPSTRPGAPSRRLLPDDPIQAWLDALESEQLDDGGWDLHFLHWSPGQTVEWRGITTLTALNALRAHSRLS